MSKTKQIAKQKLKADESYRAYIATGNKPRTHFSNPLNLFDDSNRKDRVWLNLVLKHLSLEK